MQDYGVLKQELRDKILKNLDYGKEQTDEEVLDLIDRVILEEQVLQQLPIQESHMLRMELFYSLRRLDILQTFLDDPEITEIMINGPNHIFIEKGGGLQQSELRFESAERLQNVIQQIVAGCNRVVNEASPIVDARLTDGARVNIVLPPVALNGPIVTIRRFPEHPITMEDLISYGSLSSEAAGFLRQLVQAKYNIFISGANRIIGLSQMTFRKQRVQTT